MAKFKNYLQKDPLFSDEWNVFVSFIDENNGDVVHICGYEKYPNVKDINHLFEELKTDKEFGMLDKYVDSLSVRIYKRKDMI